MSKRQKRGGRTTPRKKGFTVTYGADGRAEQCVFCELKALAHHIETSVVPTLSDESTRDRARLLVGSIRSNADDLSGLVDHYA